jgi:hypothetical protein
LQAGILLQKTAQIHSIVLEAHEMLRGVQSWFSLPASTAFNFLAVTTRISGNGVKLFRFQQFLID